MDKILLFGIFVTLGSAVWFYFEYKTPGFSIYGGHYIRWLLFFNFMLFGAKVGLKNDIKNKPIIDACLLLLCIICFYAFFIVGLIIKECAILQYFSCIPLLFAIYYFYKVGTSKWVKLILLNKRVNFIIRFIGGLSLEIYMIQGFLFTNKMNNIFPLNIVIMFIIIIVIAYFTRCLARFLSQTFKDAPYEWGKIIALY